MRIKFMRVQNFKGISDFSFDLYPKTNIYGDNATGKTTIYDAWLWLLFDKDSQNRKDFEIKPIINGETKHNVETIVEAVITIDNKDYSLKKVFKEKWVRKRGGSEPLFSGHTTEYYINNVPKKKKEYDEAIGNIVREDVFKVISNVHYFNEQLKWQDRRQILFELTDSSAISDKELAKKLKFNSLANKLDIDDCGVEDYRKMLIAQKRKLNEQLKSIPARIDELNKHLGETEDIAQLEKQLKKLQEQLKSTKLPENPYNKKIIELVKIINQKEQEIIKKIEQLKPKKSLDETKSAIKELERWIKEIEGRIEEKRQEWFKIDEQQPNIDDTCPCCGQPIPKNKIDDAITEFKIKKAEKLEAISKTGKELKLKKEKLQKDLNYLTNVVLPDIEKAEKEIEQLQNTDIPEKRQLEALYEQEKEYLNNLSNETNNEQREVLTTQIEDIQERIAQAKTQQNIKARILELEQEEKDVAMQFAEVEDALNEAEEYIKAKIKFVEKDIASKFEIARFKLFDVQINGGINETCETVVNGIPYRNLNNAMKINVGLDVIKALQAHYNKQIPIFIDNAESVNELIDMGDTQVIRLIVSKDKKLVIKEG